MKFKVLNVDNNAKTYKNHTKKTTTGILYLAPHTQSGYNLCKYASKGCSEACLFSAGFGKFIRVKKARIDKTHRFLSDREGFLSDLYSDIHQLELLANANNEVASVRLNGTSDIPWERVKYGTHTMFEHFPNVQFYDYTKWPIAKRNTSIPNYHLIFSLSEENDVEAKKSLADGVNVAVVFKSLPSTFWGHSVIDGDAHDARFLDKKGVIVGLKAKGKAKKDTTGFVR